MRYTGLFIAIISVFCAFAQYAFASTSVSASGNKILVVLDSKTEKTSPYSQFLSGLEGRGYSVTLKSKKDKFELIEYDEIIYDHLVLLSNSSSAYEGAVTVVDLIDFVNKGGNVLLAGSSYIPEILRDFTFEFSADFDDQYTAVFDDVHSMVDTSLSSGSAVYSDVFGEQASFILTPGGYDVTKRYKINPVLFNGVAHRLTGRNPLIVPVLSGNPTTYSLDDAHENAVDPRSPFIGSSVALVSAVQARNNARLVFSGSSLLFSDEFANAQVKLANGKTVQSGNKDFVEQITKWVFQEKRVLQMSGSRHHLEGQTSQHGVYRITDKMVFETRIKEFYDGKWHPFHANDIQFEAVMLDPYIRQTMVQAKGIEDSSGTKYLAFFKLPDQYGVFKFKVDYKRHGLSWIYTDDIVEVRPFRHNQYERFLTVAFPYYTNVFSMIFGFLMVSSFWLFHRDSPISKEGKVKKN